MVNTSQHKLCFIILVLLLSVTILSAGGDAQTYQTWSMTVTSGGSAHTGTLYVDSNGDFTSSGFTGSSSSGSYEIEVTGSMYGSEISVYESASYDGGNGYISGSGSGSLNADFPYATYASGSLNGYISDPLGTRDFSMSFTATKTSGGSGGDGSGSVGRTPFSYTVAAIAGIAVFAAIVGALAFRNSKAKQAQTKKNMQSIGYMPPQQPVQWRETRPVNPQYGEPAPPPPPYQQGMVPPPISMDSGMPVTGQGASVAPIDLGALPFLNGQWDANSVLLSWGTPQFDPSKYRLLGYDISQFTYGPSSTMPQGNVIGRTPAGVNQTNIQPINQTYRWSTGGDIAGYRVDPVYGQLNENGQVISQFRSGGLSIRIGQPVGTFGF